MSDTTARKRIKYRTLAMCVMKRRLAHEYAAHSVGCLLNHGEGLGVDERNSYRRRARAFNKARGWWLFRLLGVDPVRPQPFKNMNASMREEEE